MQSIKVEDLVVVRGGATVLDRLSFTVIVGVQRITSGTVTVLDRPAGHPSLRHEILSRVSLACALVAKPTLLLLDEPTVGLEGRLIADDTPDGLRSATGTQDLDEAFLRIVEHREVTA